MYKCPQAFQVQGLYHLTEYLCKVCEGNTVQNRSMIMCPSSYTGCSLTEYRESVHDFKFSVVFNFQQETILRGQIHGDDSDQQAGKTRSQDKKQRGRIFDCDRTVWQGATLPKATGQKKIEAPIGMSMNGNVLFVASLDMSLFTSLQFVNIFHNM